MAAPPSTPDPADSRRAAPGPTLRRPTTPVLVHVRGALVVVVVSVLVLGIGYPAIVTGVTDLIGEVDPGVAWTAGGSLLHCPGGTIVGSALVGQNTSFVQGNTSRDYLFWTRPSNTDYSTYNGTNQSYATGDPALLALINETISYMEQYGVFTVNASIPLDLVTPSYSGNDPYLTPEAILVQVPRVAEAIAHATNASYSATLSAVNALVNQSIVQPVYGFLGVAYVNVLELDLEMVEDGLVGTWSGICT